jgi:simple sugar transport system ATP-binding protein
MGLGDHIVGSINFVGQELNGHSVNSILDSGVAYVPESRERDGLISSFSIAENLILDVHDQAPYAKSGRYFPKAVIESAQGRVEEFDIRAQSVHDSASSLSGGNKQKVVLARELSRPVKLVVVCQPTRGLDVGSIEFVHERLIQERDSGRAVVIFSTELDEVFALADRIAIMYHGKIIAIVPSTESRENVGLYMAGVKPQGANQ